MTDENGDKITIEAKTVTLTFKQKQDLEDAFVVLMDRCVDEAGEVVETKIIAELLDLFVALGPISTMNTLLQIFAALEPDKDWKDPRVRNARFVIMLHQFLLHGICIDKFRVDRETNVPLMPDLPEAIANLFKQAGVPQDKKKYN